MDLEDDAQIDEGDRSTEIHHGLVGVPLVTHQSDSNSDSGTPIDGLGVPIHGTVSLMLI